ncbi:hypothetical protein NMY22_g9572 [Coprinellus aureogranulatus]|nr:hypothetical protein NMY22_g9572 [Coprinellus aureogranulatus]
MAALSDFSIQKTSLLHSILHLHGRMQILFKTLAGKASVPGVRSSDTVDSVNPNQQRPHTLWKVAGGWDRFSSEGVPQPGSSTVPATFANKAPATFISALDIPVEGAIPIETEPDKTSTANGAFSSRYSWRAPRKSKTEAMTAMNLTITICRDLDSTPATVRSEMGRNLEEPLPSRRVAMVRVDLQTQSEIEFGEFAPESHHAVDAPLPGLFVYNPVLPFCLKRARDDENVPPQHDGFVQYVHHEKPEQPPRPKRQYRRTIVLTDELHRRNQEAYDRAAQEREGFAAEAAAQAKKDIVAAKLAMVRSALDGIKGAGFDTLWSFFQALLTSKDQYVSAWISGVCHDRGIELHSRIHLRQPKPSEEWACKQLSGILEKEVRRLTGVFKPLPGSTVSDILESFSMDRLLEQAETAAPMLFLSLSTLTGYDESSDGRKDKDVVLGTVFAILAQQVLEAATWATPSGIGGLPRIFPTTEEFKDPMACIKSISYKAKDYGICKFIPPQGWKMAFVTDTELLRKEVQRLGRYDTVTKGKKWSDLGRMLGYRGIPGLSTQIKNSNTRVVLPSEHFCEWAKNSPALSPLFTQDAHLKTHTNIHGNPLKTTRLSPTQPKPGQPWEPCHYHLQPSV